MTNFGKPTVEVVDGNYDNSGELLLIHRYNGIVLDKKKAEETLSYLFELWGRPVNLITVGKYVSEEELDYSYSEGVEPNPEEIIMRMRYNGKEFEEFEVGDERLREEAKADEIDYKVTPEEWQ
jgi:stage V sporulation protein R